MILVITSWVPEIDDIFLIVEVDNTRDHIQVGLYNILLATVKFQSPAPHEQFTLTVGVSCMSKSSLAYFNIRLDFPTPLSPSTNILTVVLVVWSISIVGLPVQLLYYMDYNTWTYTDHTHILTL